jgi:hypothetical protein
MPPHATAHRSPRRAAPPAQGSGETLPPHELTAAWEAAVAGDEAARARWTPTEGGAAWAWDGGGLRLTAGKGDWNGAAWDALTPHARRAMKRFRLEVTVSGRARAAGLSLGDYRDLMAWLDGSGAPKRIAFEADLASGCWALFVDGVLQQRAWWDDKLDVGTLDEGMLHLKAFEAKEVRFSDLQVHALPPVPCRLSVILTCHRFAQRLRLTLASWCRQTLPMGSYEVLVVNPGSPDATHAVLAAAERAWPHVRVRELPLGGGTRNKGEMINHAFERSRGEWIWLTDADCLFAVDAAERALAHAEARGGSALLYGERRFLSRVETEALLAGRLNGVADFHAVAERGGGRGSQTEPWGYTQIVRRETFQAHRYTGAMNHYAHSDGKFIDDCRRAGVPPEPVPGLVCLHLDHPFSWFGTREML